MAESLFRWLSDWWRSGGSSQVDGTTVTFRGAGGTTAVNEPASAPVGNGLIELRLRYTAPADLPITINVSQFSGPGGPTTRLGDTERAGFTLPKADTPRTFIARLPALPRIDAVTFRPIIRSPEAGLTLEDVWVGNYNLGPRVSVWENGREVPAHFELHKVEIAP